MKFLNRVKSARAVGDYRLGVVYDGSTQTNYLNNVSGTPASFSSSVNTTGAIGIGS